MRLIDADAFERQIAGMTIANSYSVNKATPIRRSFTGMEKKLR